MKNSWTPGPWFIKPEQDGFELSTEYNGGWLFKLHDLRGKNEDADFLESQEACAHLIAAAPDMYEALLEVFESGENLDLHRRIEVLLAKARGENE